MKRTLIALLPLVFVVFVGCGGDDEEPPKPPTATDQSASTKQGFNDLYNLANKMKGSCSSGMTPIFLALAMGKPAGGASTAATPSSGGAYGSPAGAMAAPPQNCSDDLMNVLMAFTTLQFMNGNKAQLYANTPEGRKWIAMQIAGVINQVGRQLIAQGVPMTPELQQRLLVAAVDYAKNVLIPGIPSNVQGDALAGIAAYSSGLSGMTSAVAAAASGAVSTAGSAASTLPSSIGSVASTTASSVGAGGAYVPSNDPLGSTLLKNLGGTSIRGIGVKKADPNYGGFQPVH